MNVGEGSMEHFKLVSVNEKRNAARVFPWLHPAEPASLASGRSGPAPGRAWPLLRRIETLAIYAYLGLGAVALVVTLAAILVHLLG